MANSELNATKLELRKSCFNGIQGDQIEPFAKTRAHEAFVREANAEIERNRIRYATAYYKAGSYLSN